VKASVIEKAITPKTRMVILSSPNNPTVASFLLASTSAFSLSANKHNVWLMSDECYSHFTYDPHKLTRSRARRTPKNTSIIIGSMSKTFAMTGWRHWLYACAGSAGASYGEAAEPIDVEPTSIAQHAALEAMRGSMDSVPVMLADMPSGGAASWTACAPFPA